MSSDSAYLDDALGDVMGLRGVREDISLRPVGVCVSERVSVCVCVECCVRRKLLSAQAHGRWGKAATTTSLPDPALSSTWALFDC